MPLVLGDQSIALTALVTLLTFELLIESPSTGDTESTNKLFKVDGAVLVVVKDVKHIIRKLARVTKWEELLVDARELVLVELAAGAVFKETFVPRDEGKWWWRGRNN